MSTTSEVARATDSDDEMSFGLICEKAKTDRSTLIFAMIMRYAMSFEMASAIVDLCSLSEGNEEWFRGVAHSNGFYIRFPSVE